MSRRKAMTARVNFWCDAGKVAELERHRQNNDSLSDILRDCVDLYLLQQQLAKTPTPIGQPDNRVATTDKPPVKGKRIQCLQVPDCPHNKGGFCDSLEYPKGECKLSVISWMRLAVTKPPQPDNEPFIIGGEQ